MLIVADSSALIAVATCQALEVLVQVYSEVRVPQAVFAEVTAPVKPQATVLAAFLAGRVETVDLSRWVINASGLGQGEIEAMALYKQLAADALLLEDRRARLVAEHNHIHCIGALGWLLLAKKQGVITQVRLYVDR